MALAAVAAMECAVCCEAYTQVARKKVECPACQTACCSSCLQQYLLSLQGDAHCMNLQCKRAFDGEFLSLHLPKTWLLTKYKTHREKVLLDREMALLPESQEILDTYRHAQDLRARLVAIEEERRELQRRLLDVAVESGRMRRDLDVMQTSNYTRRPAGAEGAAARERRQFVRACPVDDCRGFLSTAWRCGTCETWVCKDCGEPKLNGQRDEEHVCDPGMAASHALLQRDSRPCPQCAAMIFKIDGEWASAARPVDHHRALTRSPFPFPEKAATRCGAPSVTWPSAGARATWSPTAWSTSEFAC